MAKEIGIRRISGGVDEVELAVYGQHAGTFGAQIVGADGLVYVVVREPAARLAGWSDLHEEIWRRDVRRWAAEEIGTASQAPAQTYELVWDPGRDPSRETIREEPEGE